MGGGEEEGRKRLLREWKGNDGDEGHGWERKRESIGMRR